MESRYARKLFEGVLTGAECTQGRAGAPRQGQKGNAQRGWPRMVAASTFVCAFDRRQIINRLDVRALAIAATRGIEHH